MSGRQLHPPPHARQLRQGAEHIARGLACTNRHAGGDGDIFGLKAADQIQADLMVLPFPGKAQILPGGIEPLAKDAEICRLSLADRDRCQPAPGCPVVISIK